MLPRIHRLRRKSEFDQVFSGGKSLRSTFFRIKVLSTNTQQPTRVGIIIPNKVLKKAVDRNRKKRQIRAVIQNIIVEIPRQYDIVVFALPSIQDADFSAIEKDLRSALLPQLVKSTHG